MKIFIYGTLLKGELRQSFLNDSEILGPAIVEARLYDLGQYPGIQPAIDTSDYTVGELYEIDDNTLSTLDGIEGFNPDRPGESLFVRDTINARLLSDGSSMKVMTYLFRDANNNETHIPHGDYRRHKIEQADEDHGRQYILAYGSNLLPKRLRKRVGNWKESLEKKGLIKGFRMLYNKLGNDGSGKANLCFDADYNGCPAVAYPLNTNQIKKLDECEGVPGHYLRMTVPFIESDSDRAEYLQAYVAHPDMIQDGLEPADEYRWFIEEGYRVRGFSKNNK